ncbi:MAG: sulfatase-like hydrolase/transferase, partial [Verrucomicrobiae bacterium]|nr:sulfatase-like hydrolase/transferase [Verrucomicrobiae bacterium]
PERAPVPPLYPDTPTARRTMARVHDCITAMDKRVGELLAELEREGLKDDTIVFFWSDHGQGIPRGKRTLWDTGLKVPLLVHFPEKYRHLAPQPPGTTSDRLVSLMDLGPSLLSLLELPIPPYMHGRAFLGKNAAPPREYVFGARDRVDEVLELSRSVRDKRYLYIRNFMPDLSWNQPETYSDQLELRREITKLAAEGKLNADQLTYAAPTKPPEELYDTETDPWQVKNLAGDPQHANTLERLRKTLRDWQLETRDLGMMHEWQAAKLSAETGLPLVEAARNLPLERILDTAWRVGLKGQVSEFTVRLSDPDPTVRYWAAIGLRVAGAEAKRAKAALLKALDDESLPVRVESACVLVKQFDDRKALERLAAVLACGDDNAALHAARTLELLGKQALPVVRAMREGLLRTQNMYVRWSLQNAIAALTNSSRPPLKTRRAPSRPATGESVQGNGNTLIRIVYRQPQTN